MLATWCLFTWVFLSCMWAGPLDGWWPLLWVVWWPSALIVSCLVWSADSIRPALYFILRWGTEERPALGIVIKLRSAMIWSERMGHWRSWTYGPIYVRTYHKALPELLLTERAVPG